MSRFPHLPETFILREMTALRSMGFDVQLYPLIVQHQSVIHEDAKAWIPRIHKLPYLSGDVIFANLRVFVRNPLKYTQTWFRALAENVASPKFFVRTLALFPKAVYAGEQMKRDGVQHVHAHYATHPAMVAWVIHQLTGITYSVTVHAHDIFVEKAMLATKLLGAKFVVAISEFNRAYLREHVGDGIETRIHIIHCGIVPDQYPIVSHQREQGERFEIITIGSLQPYKGQTYLLDACALLKEREIPFRCRIIGGGDLQTVLQQKIDQFGLGAHVELLGPRSQQEVAQLLQTAHCYVQPSIIDASGKMEGIPVSLMEAMATGLPVVATRLSGVPELVRDGETGWLVPPANVISLADALEDVYAHPEKVQQRVANGHQLVEQEFLLLPNVQALADILRKNLSLSTKT
jgi:glycosyltransferase involved in cell wall biosynthesis